MLIKEKVIASLKDMPKQFSVDEVIDRIILLQKIENGVNESKQGKAVSTEEAKKRLSKWLK